MSEEDKKEISRDDNIMPPKLKRQEGKKEPKPKFKCVCGSSVADNTDSRLKHDKTKKHLLYISKNEVKKEVEKEVKKELKQEINEHEETEETEEDVNLETSNIPENVDVDNWKVEVKYLGLKADKREYGVWRVSVKDKDSLVISTDVIRLIDNK